MFSDLNEDNFLLYAAKHYSAVNLLQTEFEEDLRRIKYVKRLLNKYKLTKEFKERLILNHIIILSNVFGVEATVNMLFYKCDEEDYSVLKTILIFLNYLPSRLTVTFNKKFIRQEEIKVDMIVANQLRNIKGS